MIVFDWKNISDTCKLAIRISFVALTLRSPRRVLIATVMDDITVNLRDRLDHATVYLDTETPTISYTIPA